LTNVADDAEALPSIVQLANVVIRKSMIIDKGGFGDVAQGQYQNKLVAIKTIRTESETRLPEQKKARLLSQALTIGSNDFVYQRYRMEVLIALQMDHPNVLPLLGVIKGKDMTLVSEWQENGDLNTYLSKLKRRNERPNYAKLVILPAIPLFDTNYNAFRWIVHSS
jgi:serine/threonine protein kinase